MPATLEPQVVQDPDAELVLRAGAGDAAACTQLVDRHLGKVMALAGRMLGNAADAEDAAQEVFLKVWQSARSWRPRDARFSTWLYRVTLNLCHDKLRRRRPQADAEELATLPDRAPQADSLLQRDAVASAVTAALAQLSERQREALVLTYYLELGNVAAANVLGVSVDALESLLARGRQRLRALLTDRAGDLLGDLP